MRIVYIHQYFTTPEVGGGTRSYEFARRWVAAGHEVHIICMTTDRGLSGWSVRQVEGIEVHAIPLDYSNAFGFAKRMAAYIRFARAATVRLVYLAPDAVYATSTPLTVAVPALAGDLVGGLPYVFEVRDMWPDVPIAMGYLRNPIARKAALALEYFAYRRASSVVTLAPGMRRDVVLKGVEPAKVHVIPQGCDQQVFDKPDPHELAETHPWLRGRRVVLYAGAIGPANGLGYLLDVAESTKQIDPSIVFVVIGDGKERGILQAEADARGLDGEWVRFLGYRNKHDVSAWMSLSELTLALLTGPPEVWKDAVQNKFFDSVAAGKPIATNNPGWQTQIAVEAGVGFMLPPANPKEAATILVDRLNDPQWLAAVPSKCAHLASETFNRDRQAAQALSLLTSTSLRRGATSS